MAVGATLFSFSVLSIAYGTSMLMSVRATEHCLGYANVCEGLLASSRVSKGLLPLDLLALLHVAVSPFPCWPVTQLCHPPALAVT